MARKRCKKEMVNGSVSLINGHIDKVNDEAGNQGGEENVDGQRDN